MLLLRREALELALYSFRYLGVSETVVLLPPAVLKPLDGDETLTTSTRTSPQALLFRRSDPDVQSAIGQPLRLTLTARTPTVDGIKRSPDSQSVSALTATGSTRQGSPTPTRTRERSCVLNPLPIR